MRALGECEKSGRTPVAGQRRFSKAANRPGPPRFAHRPCTIDFPKEVNWISWDVVADEVIYSQALPRPPGAKDIGSLQQHSRADYA